MTPQDDDRHGFFGHTLNLIFYLRFIIIISLYYNETGNNDWKGKPPKQKRWKMQQQKNRWGLFIFSGQLCASAALYNLPPRILLCSLDCLILSTQDSFLPLYISNFGAGFPVCVGFFPFWPNEIHWCSICWHIGQIFPWMHLRAVINFAGRGRLRF